MVGAVTTNSVLAFAVLAAVLTVLPGSDFALTLRWALRGGPGHAFAAALGIATGSLCWATGWSGKPRTLLGPGNPRDRGPPADPYDLLQGADVHSTTRGLAAAAVLATTLLLAACRGDQRPTRRRRSGHHRRPGRQRHHRGRHHGAVAGGDRPCRRRRLPLGPLGPRA